VPLSLGQLVNVDGMGASLQTRICHLCDLQRCRDCFDATRCLPHGRPQGHNRLPKAFDPRMSSTPFTFLTKN
jgi:hypothetical protein